MSGDRGLAEADNLPRWDGRKRGHYEVWYLTLTDPATGAAFWIRYTLEAPKDRSHAPYARLWFTSFDPDAEGGGVAVHRDVPIDGYAGPPPGQPFGLAMGDSALTHGEATGSIGAAVRWSLRWTPAAQSHRHLPDIAYRVPITSTTVLSPTPSARFTGEITCGGRTYAIDDAPGCQTHLWGRKHAETWAWGRASSWDGGEDAFFEGIGGRVKRFGLLLPPLTVLSVRLGSAEHHLKSLGQARRTRAQWSTGHWSFAGEDRTLRIEGEITHPPSDLVLAHYHDPDGEDSYCHNSERCSLALSVSVRSGPGAPWERRAELSATHLAHAEWGDRTANPAVLRRIQPA